MKISVCSQNNYLGANYIFGKVIFTQKICPSLFFSFVERSDVRNIYVSLKFLCDL